MKRQSVALFSAAGYDGISTPLINTAKFLASQHYSVDIYIQHSDALEMLGLALHDFPESNIHIYDCRCWIYKCCLGFKWAAREIEYFLRNIKRRKNYMFCIGFDPEGLIRAASFATLWGIPYLYHSLEFYESANFIKRLELYCASKALLILTQDEQRKAQLTQLLRVEEEKILISTNSPIGDCLLTKDRYFHKKFSIPANKKIVLFTGSIIEECYPMELVESVSNWPDEFVLVLHGWVPNIAFAKSLNNRIKEQKGRVFLSTDILPADKKYIIFQSVDIGVVLFKPVNLNLTYAAGSAGKLYDFMRCGVPIIGNDIPGMKMLISNNRIGEVIDQISSINLALSKIMMDYSEYAKNSAQVYKKYEFCNSYQPILSRVEKIIGR